MFGTSWGSYFYIIHEGTITGTLIKLKPKQGTVYIIKGTLSGTFGQEKKQTTWYIASQIRRNAVLKIRKKNGKVKQFRILGTRSEEKEQVYKKQQYNNTEVGQVG